MLWKNLDFRKELIFKQKQHIQENHQKFNEALNWEGEFLFKYFKAYLEGRHQYQSAEFWNY